MFTGGGFASDDPQNSLESIRLRFITTNPPLCFPKLKHNLKARLETASTE
jgi:hypothetical protein